MARQLDNSVVRFSQQGRPTAPTGLSITIAVLLAGGVLMSLVVQVWGFVVLFGLSLLGFIVYSFMNVRAMKALKAERDQARIDWESALPEVQRESLNIEVIELSRVLDVKTEQISDLQSAYIVAEDLALRQIQQEEQVPLLRHVSIGEIPFDAVFVKQESLICGEVSFLVAPDLRQERIDAMMRKMSRVRKMVEQSGVALKPRLMVILVTQLTSEDEDRLRKNLTTKRFAGTPVDVDIRLLDFEALQRIYVTD